MSAPNTITTDFCVGTWNLECLQVRFTYGKSFRFVDYQKVAIDITGDDFSMEIKDALGGVVETLTVGGGITISDTNKLSIIIGSLTTDVAGVYRHRLVWTRPMTGEVVPALSGKIVVKP